MNFEFRGIGWLIFGVLVCASSFEADGFFAKLSTIALGLVFVAVFLIKNWFDPRYKALFILGGLLVAFSIENGRDEDTFTALICAAVFFAIFYFINRDAINAWLGGARIVDYGYEEEEFEEYEDPQSESEAEDDGATVPADTDAPAGPDEEVVDFEFDRADH